MKLEFHPEAIAELRSAAEYYEECRPGLGQRFVDAVEDAVRRISGTPLAWRLFEHDVRRCLTRVFPYGVFYTRLDESILIVAVGHLRVSPDTGRPAFERALVSGRAARHERSMRQAQLSALSMSET